MPLTKKVKILVPAFGNMLSFEVFFLQIKPPLFKFSLVLKQIFVNVGGKVNR